MVDVDNVNKSSNNTRKTMQANKLDYVANAAAATVINLTVLVDCGRVQQNKNNDNS